MKHFIRTPREYVGNLFGRVQLTFQNLCLAVAALVGFRPEALIKGVYDRGDRNEKRPSISREKAAEYAAWATRVMNQLGIRQTKDGMLDCPNTARLKAELINAKASLDGLTGASLSGSFGYTRDVDGKGHELTQIIIEGGKRVFVEGHEAYANLRELSNMELASCELDIIG